MNNKEFEIKLIDEEKENVLIVSKGKVKDIIAMCNIDVNENIAITPDLQTDLYENIEIIVKKITPIEKKIIENTDTLKSEQSKIIEKPIHKTKPIAIKKKPKKSMDMQDLTNAQSNTTFKDKNGKIVNYSKFISGICTAYNANEGGSLTSTGKHVRVGYVAVDPKIIPYGSKLYITSPDNKIVYGYAEAQDTGGAMRQRKALIDLFYKTDKECRHFGRRKMNVYVL